MNDFVLHIIRTKTDQSSPIKLVIGGNEATFKLFINEI